MKVLGRIVVALIVGIMLFVIVRACAGNYNIDIYHPTSPVSQVPRHGR